MTQIEVNASKRYRVIIGSGALSQISETLRSVTKAKKVCIVSDSHVWPLYGNLVHQCLGTASLEICSFVFPAGEESKNGQTYLNLLQFLAEEGLCRSDCIIALGGGVVGDLAGFAAATYLRGIPYIQAPTTLLSMVDSSVGGKTAINLPKGKNLWGAFWQPAAVLCDLGTLRTLPEEDFRDGCAEVIKYAILYDSALFAHLEENSLSLGREYVISRCIALKRDVVNADEFDTGARQMLNLGHTIGHAIEKCSQFSISHGKAVAIGIAMVCRAAGCKDADRILALLQRFGLPTITEFSADVLAAAALSDKKRGGDTIHLIIPRAIGHCEIVSTPTEALKTFIEEGM